MRAVRWKESDMKIPIVLNGTDENRFAQYGLKRNPFPAIPKAGYTGVNNVLAKLAAEPIPSVDYLRAQLKGFHPEFIRLCCSWYRKGEVIRVMLDVPDEVLDMPGYDGGAHG
jgi:hypothetical protein